MVYTRRKWAMTWAAGGAGTGVLTIATATMQAGSSWIVFVEGPEHGIQRADAGGAIDQSVKRVQHQDEAGSILKSLASAAQAGFVKLTDGTLALLLKLASTAPTAGMVVVPTQPVDRQGNVIAGGGGTSGGLALYQSHAGHFTVARNSATELDLAGMVVALIINGRNFVSIKDYDATGAFTAEYKPSTHVFTWDAANSRIAVTDAVFTVGGSWQVEVLGLDRTLDIPGDQVKVAVGNPYELRGDDSGVSILAAAQDFTDAFADCGSEISMFGKSGCTFFITLDINDDADLRFRVLGKHTSAGAEEYPLAIKSPGAGVVAVEALYYEFTSDTDQLIVVRVETNGEIPYLQLQIMRGVNGAGVAAQVDALAYVRGTFGGAA